MKKRFVLIAVAVMAFFSANVSAQVKGIVKEETSSNELSLVAPEGTGFQVSPDGKLLAYFGVYKEVPNLFVVPINGGEVMQVSFVGDKGVQEFYWLKNHLVAFVTKPDFKGNAGLFVGDFQMGEFRRVSPEGTNVRVNAVSSGSGLLFYEMNSVQAPKTYNFFRFNVEDLSSTVMAENATGWLSWAPDFSASAAFSYESREGRVSLLSSGGDKFALLDKCVQFKPVASSATAKGKYICISDNARNGSALVEINLSDGKESQVLFAKPGSSIERVFLSSKDRRPMMVWYNGKENGFQFIDKSSGALMDEIKSKIPGVDALELADCSADEKVWIVYHTHSDGRKVYYRYNVSNKDVRQLNEVDLSQDLKRAKLSVQTIKDTRGRELVVRTYMPPVEEFKYPALLVFGERMWSLNSPEHDHLLQQLCLQGYPVFEVDLVHSQSYGAEALLNGFEWWSGMLVSDLPGVFALINRSFPTVPGVVPVGMGIGAEIAMRAMGLYPDLKMRSILIQPYLDKNMYAARLESSRSADLRFIVKSGEMGKEYQAPDMQSAANPMLIYSLADESYAQEINSKIQMMAISGNSPAVVNYSDERGMPTSDANVSQVVSDAVGYIGAIALKKIK